MKIGKKEGKGREWDLKSIDIEKAILIKDACQVVSQSFKAKKAQEVRGLPFINQQQSNNVKFIYKENITLARPVSHNWFEFIVGSARGTNCRAKLN